MVNVDLVAIYCVLAVVVGSLVSVVRKIRRLEHKVNGLMVGKEEVA